MERMNWDEYFMAQSVLLAMRSTCNRLAVGAVLVRDRRVIAGGYNGSVSGDVHCIDEGCYMVGGHCIRTIHAEMNALLQCAKLGIKADGAEIYVTHFPCLECTKAMVQTGIQTIHYLYDYHNNEYALKLLKQNDVKLHQVNLSSKVFEQAAAEMDHIKNQKIKRD